VPAYPIEPEKLLDAANKLAPPDAPPGRPSYTSHRRATSTAYYAVFHAICARVASLVFPNAGLVFQREVMRWIAHSDIATVCRWISILQGNRTNGVSQHIRTLLEPPSGPSMIDGTTIAIADGFLELHEKREEADYDHDAVFARADTRGHIRLATRLVSMVENASTPEAMTFFGLVAIQAKIRGR
jgi:hypothetical protein